MINFGQISHKSGIYLLKNLINNKIYIGKATNLYKRLASHKSSAKRKIKGYYITSAMIKYGIENFELEILHDFNDKIDNIVLLALETAFIDFYNSTNRNIGYNILKFTKNDATGHTYPKTTYSIRSQTHSGKNNGMYGKKHTEETKLIQSLKAKERKITPFKGKYHDNKTKKILSQKAKERMSKPENVPFKGKHHTEENKKILSQKAIIRFSIKENCPFYGKKVLPENRIKMSKATIEKLSIQVKQIDKDSCKITKIWWSMAEAIKFLKKNENYIGHISKACKTNCVRLGYKWSKTTREEYYQFKKENPHLYDDTGRDDTIQNSNLEHEGNSSANLSSTILEA